MRMIPLFSCAFLLACGAAPPRASDPSGARAEVAAVLDAWHEAAARSDLPAYLGHMTEDSIFLGTDATERWTREQLRAYAERPFGQGRGWVFRAVRRDVIVDDGGALAWFDEDLDTVGLGPARGSGVLRLEPDGRWRIAHYNLALTVPNERFDEVRALLSAPAPAAEPAD